jgi:hypothetical protein
VDYDDRGLVALPKLVGGPKYSRPPAAGAPRTDRPPDPDDLPLESVRSPEDQALAAELGLAAPHVPAETAAAVGTPTTHDTGGHGDPHADGVRNAVDGATTGVPAKPTKRALGVLFRGRSGQHGAD